MQQNNDLSPEAYQASALGQGDWSGGKSGRKR
jgi:hypothetical protein